MVLGARIAVGLALCFASTAAFGQLPPTKTQKPLFSGVGLSVVDVVPTKISFKEVVLEVVFALDNGLPFELRGWWMGGTVSILAEDDPGSGVGAISIEKTAQIVFRRRAKTTFSVRCRVPTAALLGSIGGLLSAKRIKLQVNGSFRGFFLYLFGLRMPLQQGFEFDVGSFLRRPSN